MKAQIKFRPVRPLLTMFGLLATIALPFTISSPVHALFDNVVSDGSLGEYPSATTAPVLSFGIVSPVVGDLQYFLSDQGFYGGAADNVYGDATYEAVIRFQQAQGITADGVVGSETWVALLAIDDQIALGQ
jgi:Putative peptidoglycan binding domain